MKTKTILSLLLVAGSIGAAQAQDASGADGPPPAVVYEAPVVYNAPVVYQALVVYYAPVYYGATPAACVLNACGAVQNNAALSTVTYIGGGQVGYQVAPPCNTGSTVVFIGEHSQFR
ncbi:MAG TPA: hypothetical protein VH597_04805 [Verrucomicrobiae bacterium]|jgi:hypothetical protein|nr:hypothetical protein [Verrucomicrobiae bacterium]